MTTITMKRSRKSTVRQMRTTSPAYPYRELSPDLIPAAAAVSFPVDVVLLSMTDTSVVVKFKLSCGSDKVVVVKVLLGSITVSFEFAAIDVVVFSFATGDVVVLVDVVVVEVVASKAVQLKTVGKLKNQK